MRAVNRAMMARIIGDLSTKQPLNGWEMPPVPQENRVPVIIPHFPVLR
jgi:hypothetical protein